MTTGTTKEFLGWPFLGLSRTVLYDVVSVAVWTANSFGDVEHISIYVSLYVQPQLGGEVSGVNVLAIVLIFREVGAGALPALTPRIRHIVVRTAILAPYLIVLLVDALYRVDSAGQDGERTELSGVMDLHGYHLITYSITYIGIYLYKGFGNWIGNLIYLSRYIFIHDWNDYGIGAGHYKFGIA